jgi:hypothetical protein
VEDSSARPRGRGDRNECTDWELLGLVRLLHGFGSRGMRTINLHGFRE